MEEGPGGLFRVPEKYEHWAREQETLAARVEIPGHGGYAPRTGDVVCAMDIQYDGDEAHVAADLSRWQGPAIGLFAAVTHVDVPYVPSYFCFREGPPLLRILRELDALGLPAPDVVVVDGHGIAHPRRFGAACWLGVQIGRPTIGCAKETLLPFEGQLAQERGSTLEIALRGEVVGFVLRRQSGVNPVFVSPGHMVSLRDAADIALELPSAYRVPDPIRNADRAARAHAKGLEEKGCRNLGRLG